MKWQFCNRLFVYKRNFHFVYLITFYWLTEIIMLLKIRNGPLKSFIFFIIKTLKIQFVLAIRKADFGII